MGIPSYFISLLKNNSTLLHKLSSNLVINGLYFDSNSIIYDVIRELETNAPDNKIANETIYKMVCEKLMFYINTIQPRNEVYISIDGVAPAAKMEQQRQRRYKTQLIMNMKQDIEGTSACKMNTTQITPGTEFMEQLCRYMNKYFNSHKIYNAVNNRINVILSLSDIPGEGEHKIYNYIRQQHSDLQNKYDTDSYKHIVYGLDSDLIMLSLINSDVVDNIYLVREAPHFIKQINKKYSPGVLYYIDFNKIKEIITHGIHQDDYVLISFILGNDFIPHNPAFNLRNSGLDTVINMYKNVFADTVGGRNITCSENGGRSIHMANLKALFIELSKIEKVHFKDNIERKFKFAGKPPRPGDKKLTLDDKLNFIPKINFEKERNIFMLADGEHAWKSNYYKICLHTDYYPESSHERNGDLITILDNYLDALFWNFDYYTQHKVDVFWKYNYHHAPLLGDVVRVMSDFDFDGRFSKGNCFSIEDNPIHPQTQLAYVLPRESHHFLKNVIKTYVSKTMPELTNHNLDYDYAFSTYLWEGHLDLNYIDIQHLNDVITKCVKTYIKHT